MDCSIGGLHWGPLIYGNYHIDLRDIKLISPKDLLISLHILSGPPHFQGDLVSRLMMGISGVTRWFIGVSVGC